MPKVSRRVVERIRRGSWVGRAAASVVLVVLMLGCTGGGVAGEGDGATQDGDARSGDAEGPGTIDAGHEGELFVFGFGYDTGDIIARSRIDSVREQYGGIELDFSESGFDEQQFLSALASDRPPDVVNIPRNLLGTYIARGVLQPLDACIEAEGVDTSAFYDGAIDQVTLDGQIWALPEFFNTRVWILNDAAFEEAGLDPETVDLSDWEGLDEVNEQLTATEGGQVTRIGLDPKLPEFLPLWAWANGAPMLSEDGRESYLDDPGVAEALEIILPWHEAAGGRTDFLDFRDTWDFFGAENQYATDQLAGMPMEQWYLNVLAEVSPDVQITVRPFVGPDGEPLTWADGNSWAIPQRSTDPEAACAFAVSMTETETWVTAAEARAEEREQEGVPNTGVYTGNREADEVIFTEIVDLSETPVFEAAVEVVLEGQEAAFGLPPSPAAAAFETAWRDAVNEVLLGADPEEELEQADQAAQDAIDAGER